MNKHKFIIINMAWIAVTMIIIGELSFFISGGIPALASDVGLSGSWGLSIFIQFLYAALSITGFVIFLLLGKNQGILKANKLPSILSASIIAASINVFGVYYKGASVQFIWFAIAVVVLSALMYLLVSFACNSLTHAVGPNHSLFSRFGR